MTEQPDYRQRDLDDLDDIRESLLRRFHNATAVHAVELVDAILRVQNQRAAILSQP